MRKIHEVVEDIKSILNNIERTEECTGETLVDINELVDEILSIDAAKQKLYISTTNPYMPDWKHEFMTKHFQSSPFEYFNIPIDEFNDLCDSANSFTELKEILLNRTKQEDKQ